MFGVAQAIDLDQAERSIGGGSERQTFRHRGRATLFFQHRPAPRRVSQERTPIEIEGWKTEPSVDLEATSTRKLTTIESIYQKLSAKAASTRMEALEWVVIILIALEIILGLLK